MIANTRFIELSQKFRQMYADVEMYEEQKKSRLRDLEEAKMNTPEIEGTRDSTVRRSPRSEGGPLDGWLTSAESVRQALSRSWTHSATASMIIFGRGSRPVKRRRTGCKISRTRWLLLVKFTWSSSTSKDGLQLKLRFAVLLRGIPCVVG